MKQQFIPMNYELDLLKKLQGFKQAGKSVQEYTEDLYWVLIRTGHVEANMKKVTYYLNGLRSRIQDELSLVWKNYIDEVYKFSSKIEEKLRKFFDKKSSGRGHHGWSRERSYGQDHSFEDHKNRD